MKQYAYVRVSAKDQNVSRQLDALKPYDIPSQNIFCDYQSGKDFNRPQYRKLMRKLREGDLLIIKSIDRLGRNYDEILEQWRRITKEIHADILVLDMKMLDTRNRDGNLTGALIADLVLQILAYVAQTERDFIRQRQAEGIASAKERGVKLGRKPMELPDNFEAVCEDYRTGKTTIRAAAQALHISRTTFHRKYHERLQQEQLLSAQKKLVTESENFGTNSRHSGTAKEVGDTHEKSEAPTSFGIITILSLNVYFLE